LHAFFPKINEPIKFNNFIQQKADNLQMGIAHCDDGNKESLSTFISQVDTCILIGPEGDFTAHEIELAVNAGARQLSLGNYRLRTETAGLMACNAFALLNKYI
jgi:16S rRNA (uracil1498-N3)-methyltransferase